MSTRAILEIIGWIGSALVVLSLAQARVWRFRVMNFAGAILATLWPVADASTGIFMSLFYQMRNELRLSKAEALREVQSIFISGTHDAEGMEPEHRGIREADGDGGGFTPPPGAPFAHPFYWAPFILMGNFL